MELVVLLEWPRRGQARSTNSTLVSRDVAWANGGSYKARRVTLAGNRMVAASYKCSKVWHLLSIQNILWTLMKSVTRRLPDPFGVIGCHSQYNSGVEGIVTQPEWFCTALIVSSLPTSLRSWLAKACVTR
jgi:hypothetical protein